MQYFNFNTPSVMMEISQIVILPSNQWHCAWLIGFRVTLYFQIVTDKSTIKNVKNARIYSGRINLM